MNKYTEKEINDIYDSIEQYKTKYIKSDSKPFCILMNTLLGLGMSIHYSKDYILAVPLISCFSLKLFIIFHDCCHNSYFKQYKYNNRISNIIESLCLYPKYKWRDVHNLHHKSHGNLSEYDGTRTVITVEEYNNLNIYYKCLYRIFRSPPIFFIISPIYIFWINHLSYVEYTSKYILGMYILYKVYGIRVLYKYILGQYISTVIGVMLFHLQHQVNEGYWKKFNNKNKIEWEKAQLHGASMLKIPYILKFFTLGIEYHHIHHLSTQIPSYNLQLCHENNEDKFNKITRVGYKQALLSLFHTLYDEINRKYISFNLAKIFGLEY